MAHMAHALPEEMTCQAERRGRVHGARLGIADRPVVPTGRVLLDVRLRDPGRIAAWCYQCHRASEYRYATADEAAAVAVPEPVAAGA